MRGWGEVAGEYCPGQHSVNARGERKLMGVGQRLIRGRGRMWVGWSWWGRASGYGMCWCRCTRRWRCRGVRRRWGAWRRSLAARPIAMGLWGVVVDAILAEFGARYGLYEGAISGETLGDAEGLEGEHVAP